MKSAGSQRKRDHLSDNLIDHDTLRIVSVQMLDARGSPYAGDEDENYNMRIVSACLQSFNEKVEQNAHQ